MSVIEITEQQDKHIIDHTLQATSWSRMRKGRASTSVSVQGSSTTRQPRVRRPAVTPPRPRVYKVSESFIRQTSTYHHLSTRILRIFVLAHRAVSQNVCAGKASEGHVTESLLRRSFENVVTRVGHTSCCLGNVATAIASALKQQCSFILLISSSTKRNLSQYIVGSGISGHVSTGTAALSSITPTRRHAGCRLLPELLTTKRIP